MKARSIAVFLLALVLVGCSKRPPPPSPQAQPKAEAQAPQTTAETPKAESDAPPRESAGVGPSKAPGAGAVLLGDRPVSLQDLTDALRAYCISRQVTSKNITDLDILVKNKFLPSLPPPPPGKKYVWDRYSVVTLADK
jgi:hypothetical protein